jgi:hypothetical protein
MCEYQTTRRLKRASKCRKWEAKSGTASLSFHSFLFQRRQNIHLQPHAELARKKEEWLKREDLSRFE